MLLSSARLKERTGISVSVTTMHRAVQRLDLRRKKKLFTQMNKILHG